MSLVVVEVEKALELGEDPVETLLQLAVIRVVGGCRDVALNLLDVVKGPVEAKRTDGLNNAADEQIWVEERVLADVRNLLGTQKHRKFAAFRDLFSRRSHGTGWQNT